MKQSENVIHEVLSKLHDLIHSKEGLWREIGELSRSIDYVMLHGDFASRALMKLEVIEKHLGYIQEIAELRALLPGRQTVSPS